MTGTGSYHDGPSFFFRGDTIYSYGQHFPIARHVTGTRGRAAVLFTTRDYSKTTSKHKGEVRGAIPGRFEWLGNNQFRVTGTEVFFVSDPTAAPLSLLAEYWPAQIEQAKAAIAQPRIRQATRATRTQELLNLIERANTFAEFFGSRKRFKAPASIDPVALRAKLIEAARVRDIRRAALRAKYSAEYDARNEARRIEQSRTDAENIAAWLAGENVSARSYNWPTLLRVQGEDVQTTKGAIFPIEHARLALAMVRRTIATGEAYVRNGHTIHLGPYALDSIAVDGTVTAGCHVIEPAEIERFGAILDATQA
jgi:hypothetical protein